MKNLVHIAVDLVNFILLSWYRWVSLNANGTGDVFTLLIVLSETTKFTKKSTVS